MQQIGCKIKEFRSKNKILQKELAEKSGLDKSMISKIEHGVSKPSLSSLEKISKALGIKAADLL